MNSETKSKMKSESASLRQLIGLLSRLKFWKYRLKRSEQGRARSQKVKAVV